MCVVMLLFVGCCFVVSILLCYTDQPSVRPCAGGLTLVVCILCHVALSVSCCLCCQVVLCELKLMLFLCCDADQPQALCLVAPF